MKTIHVLPSFWCCCLGLGLSVGRSPSAPIPGLFSTGVNDSGGLLAAGAVDPHYRLIQSPDASGPNAFTVNDAYPIAPAGPWLAHGPESKWIAPQTSQATGNPPGDYVYRLTFDLTGLEPSTVEVTGRWTSDNASVDIRINGVSTGLNYDGNFGAWSAYWTINSGFQDGVNTLDFVINNAGTGVNPTGFRAELSGTADLEAPPGTAPSILEQPAAATVGQGDAVTFRVSVYGSKPLFYQWRQDGQPVPGATNAVFSLASVNSADAGRYDVVVTNAVGSATSEPASLNIVFLSPAQLSYEPPGPSSRRTGLAFSEIMYHPADRSDGRNLEFIELFNSNPFFEDLSGYRLSGEVDYTFPDGTRIEGLGYLVVAPVPADIAAVHGLTNVLGGFTNRLNNAGGALRLRKRSGGIVLDLTYNDQPPWPAAADGPGHSLVLVRPSYGERAPHAWAASAFKGGSPGAADSTPSGPLENILINEILAHTDLPLLDYVELYNHSPMPVDVGGCWLSDDPNTNKFQIPPGTLLSPRGFLAYDEVQLGFGLSANGETIYLVTADQQRVLQTLRYDGQANGVAYGRFPDGADGFQELSARTPGETNAPMLIREIVINEIMYHPISQNADDEFVELHNWGTDLVDLSGWQFQDGIDFAFAPGTTLAAGGYLVVARNAARLLTNYPGLDPALVVGDFGGSLADGGERLALARPVFTLTTNLANGAIATNVHFAAVDEVTYVDGGQWGRWADGGGSSLELTDPHSDNRLAANWADSDESAKAPWTLVEHTGLLDHGTGTASTNLQLHLQGAGEALVDNVEVTGTTGGNRIANGTFESGLGGWALRGTQRPSSLETTEGYNSAQSLRLRATDRGDTVNMVKTSFTSAFTPNQTATIRAQVRWLRGHPEILFRFKENYLEAVGRMTVPTNLGTPGAPNSRSLANAGPAITGVTHRPPLPAVNQPIRVFARVQDSDGVAGVTLRYRIDPGSTLVDVPMADNGTSGDLVAGDGVYAGLIPGQPIGTLVAFRLEAADAAAVPASRPFPADAPERECLVRVGESVPAGAFGTYRIWITQATFNLWSSREKMSNEAFDATFVHGHHRVIYNAGSYFAGSAWTSPGYTTPSGALCGYDILFPDDDLFLGDDHVILDWPVRDPTNQREQAMFWLLEQYGLPNLYRRYVHLFVNGARRGTIYDDVQQPGGDVIAEWYPNDADGDFYKTGFYFEFSDGGAREGGTPNTLENFTTTGGVKKTARYRWNWKPRAVRGSENNFATLFELVDTLNTQGEAYRSAVEKIVDVDHWMRTFAMNDLASYWDGFGNPNYKNTYLYKPERDGWKLFCWDFDVGLGAGINIDNERYNAPLFPAIGDPAVARLYQTPGFVRAYWRALDEALNTFFTEEAITPMLTAKYQAFLDHNVNLTSPFVASGPFGYTIPSFITQRRAFLLTQLATVAAAFNVDGPSTLTVDQNLLHFTGTAPVRVQTLTVNGTACPVTWTSVSNWSLRLVVPSGASTLAFAGFDRLGQPVSGATGSVAVTFTGADISPVDVVVINEILYNPLVPGASFIELFNTSPTHAFDLSGWRINGLDFTFPSGSVIANRQYLVLAKNATDVRAAFGFDVPVFAEFDGTLANEGETLTLFMPGTSPGEEIIVDRVTYDDAPPWPPAAAGQGASLQLMDALQDNNRASNWSDGQGWRYFTYTANVGTLAGTRLSLFFDTTGGDLWLDDLSLVQGDTPDAGPNVLQNGGFEAGTASWILGPQAASSTVVTEDVHAGAASLYLNIAPGPRLLTTFYQDFPAVTPSTNYTLSFWYKPGTNQGRLFGLRINSLFYPQFIVEQELATPGAPNGGTADLAPYPPLWLSEVQPNNQTTATDNFGEADPWIEVHNSGTQPLDLTEVCLSDQLNDLTAWPFPAGSTIQPGEFRLIWADATPAQTDAGHWHASFRLPPTNGSVYLARRVNGSVQLLDYFHYGLIEPDAAYGAYPPAQNSYRQVFFQPTPGGTNEPAPPPVALFLNEWMAANTGSVRDPADQDADDWFELFNPNPTTLDLAGYRLTDDPTRPAKYVIPAGFAIGPLGFLVAWADEEAGQTQAPDRLHVNFKLSGEGEQIQLYSPLGQLVDAVAFGPQATDLSEGRYPDGAAQPYPRLGSPTPGAPNQAPTAGHPEIETIRVERAAGTATLQWTAELNANYRVQFKDRLSDPEWQDLPGDVQAAGPTASKTDFTLSSLGQRFYRILQVP